MSRDPRWETIKAYMGPKREYRGDEFDQGVNLEDWYEITMELNYAGHYFWRFEMIHRADWVDLVEGDPEAVSWILDEMVKQMDESIERVLSEKNQVPSLSDSGS